MVMDRQSAWEKHNEALIERALRIRTMKEQRKAERLAREKAELAATGQIVRDVSPVAAAIAKLSETKDKGNWFKWW